MEFPVSFLFLIHNSTTISQTYHLSYIIHSLPSIVESVKEEISRSQEDQKKLMPSGDDRLQEEDEESETDNSIVLYETEL